MDIVRALGLKDREMIGVVGAGGKTTLIFHLAKELQRMGKKVLISTTTRMFKPSSEQGGPLIFRQDIFSLKDEISRALKVSGTATLAQREIEESKIKGVMPEILDDLFETGICDYILVEADGSRRKPIKAPGSLEPQIPPKTTWALGVIGLDALDKTLDDQNVHRPELLSNITGTPLGAKIDGDTVLRLILHRKGLFKDIDSRVKKMVVLNKADNNSLLGKAQEIAKKAIKVPEISENMDGGKYYLKEGNSEKESKLFIEGILITSFLKQIPLIAAFKKV